MNCNCLSDTKKKMLETQPLKNRTLTDITFPDIQFGWDKNASKMVSFIGVRIQMTVQERKTPLPQVIIPPYCPFCGTNQQDKKPKVIASDPGSEVSHIHHL